MLKKSLAGATLVAALALPGLSETVLVNGQPLVLDQAPTLVNGQMMVPMRGIFESLGATVQFDRATNLIRATQGQHIVQLTLGSPTANVDGQMLTLSAPPRVIAGRTLVPLRFVAQALGAEVNYSSMTRTVAINTPSSAHFIMATPAVQPRLSAVTHNGGQMLEVGDRLIVSMTGDPGGQASFEIVGSGRQVPMREVSAGRYEGELVLDESVPMGDSSIVGRLTKNGKEATLQASTALKVAEAVPPVPLPMPTLTVTPANGATVETARPQVSVVVPQPMAPGSTTLIVDGQNVTSQSRWNGNQLVYTPTHDLSPGAHGLEVRAIDLAGRPYTQTANFTIRQNITGAPGSRQSMDVSITNLEPGSSVSDVFNVEGKTVPYAAVRVSLDTSGPFSSGQNPITSGTAVANEFGEFNVDLDARSVPADSPVTLRVQANDGQGRQGPVRTVEVIRR